MPCLTAAATNVASGRHRSPVDDVRCYLTCPACHSTFAGLQLVVRQTSTAEIGVQELQSVTAKRTEHLWTSLLETAQHGHDLLSTGRLPGTHSGMHQRDVQLTVAVSGRIRRAPSVDAPKDLALEVGVQILGY